MGFVGRRSEGRREPVQRGSRAAALRLAAVSGRGGGSEPALRGPGAERGVDRRKRAAYPLRPRAAGT